MTARHAGFVNCEASNQAGSVSRSSILSVNGTATHKQSMFFSFFFFLLFNRKTNVDETYYPIFLHELKIKKKASIIIENFFIKYIKI